MLKALMGLLFSISAFYSVEFKLFYLKGLQ